MEFIIIIFIIFILCLFLFTNKENFWGGYFPTPYLNNPFPNFGRYSVNAATDQIPLLNIDPISIPINKGKNEIGYLEF